MIIFRVVKKLILYLIICGWVASAQAEIGHRPIITADGNEIYPITVRSRLSRLLTELGEPKWSPKELSRLMEPVFLYLTAFTGRQYDRVLDALRRGDKYRPMIRKKLLNSSIPSAFEALPMAESAYRYDARSKQGAYGLWQFIPSSARRYGLKITRGFDERSDPVRATDAAIKYLTRLNKKFGDISILLSVAAYNAGEGRIQRVVRKSGLNKKTRGYSRVIRFLPKETRGYVPEFLAAALIVKNPELYGFPVSKSNSHSFIQIAKPQRLNKIVKLTDVNINQIYALNPELEQRSKIPANNFIIRLPKNAAERLDKRLSSTVMWAPLENPITLHEKKIVAQKDLIYTARKGNHLGGIASLFDVSIEDLRKWNKIKGNSIKIGQRIKIRVKKPLAKKSYRIQSGDKLEYIARQLGVSIESLMFINGVSSPKKIWPGDRLFYYEQQT